MLPKLQNLSSDRGLGQIALSGEGRRGSPRHLHRDFEPAYKLARYRGRPTPYITLGVEPLFSRMTAARYASPHVLHVASHFFCLSMPAMICAPANWLLCLPIIQQKGYRISCLPVPTPSGAAYTPRHGVHSKTYLRHREGDGDLSELNRSLVGPSRRP